MFFIQKYLMKVQEIINWDASVGFNRNSLKDKHQDVPNDEGNKHFWNVGQFLRGYMAKHYIPQPSSYSTP